MIKIKRVYDGYNADDGYRILVDRLWPRGVRKEDANIDEWIKGVTPSTDLRKWYGHDPEKWLEFQQLYFKELESATPLIHYIFEKQVNQTVTLVYAAKDIKHTHAIALKEFIELFGAHKI